jgi:TonB-linked SusC/RagA family outer membrane protein
MKKLSLLLVMFFAMVGTIIAQRTVTGKVTDSKGEALIGANIVAKGTNAGTTTDVDGNYSLNVPANATTLVISYTAFTAQEIALGSSNVVDVSLREDANVIDEVVVTALGIKRDKKALGYAATVVSAAAIAEKPETDVARTLAGKSPGVNIVSSSGIAGSGTKINIRGVSTISGNAQPLWIIDGVPVNTADNDRNGDFRDGKIAPTRNLDIDPNNIESMSILRGLSATTLYGAQGRNGVILITTKTGSGGNKNKGVYASVSQSYNQVEAFIPEFQNKWGNGFDAVYGEFFSNWGSLFENPSLPYSATNAHPYREWSSTFPDNADIAVKQYIPQAAPNNVKDFFQKGTSLTTSVNAGITGDFGSFNTSFSRLGESGFIANNNINRTNLTIGGLVNVTKKFNIGANVSFIQTDFKTPPVAAGLGSNSDGGPSVFANLFYTPRNIDLMNLPYQNPNNGSSVYYRNNNSITNPRWLLENAGNTSVVNRTMTQINANYSLTSWLRATYRLGVDNYSEARSYFVNKGSVGYPTAVAAMANGLYRTTNNTNTIYDNSVILSANKNITNDLDVTANIGVNSRQDKYNQTGLESQNQVVFGLLEHRNFISNTARDIRGKNLNFKEKENRLGAFADFTFGYKNAVYLNVQGRNDWASTHEKDFRRLFYPGFSLAVIPTELFGIKSKALDFLKLRIGYGTSANFATPYRTRPYLTLNANASVDANGNVIALSLADLLANPNLKPELQREFETGFDARLFSNRVGIDFSFYNRKAQDQIVERTLDPSTGYARTFVNAGTIQNRGIELGLTVTPIKTSKLQWDLRANFTRNISKVLSLPAGSKEILISGYSNLGNFAIEGQPFGVIKGTNFVFNDAGQRIVTENGDWEISPSAEIIGDPNEKFRLSGFSDLTYRGFTLGAQLDYVHGGQIFSYSAGTLIGRGVAKELENYNVELTVILPGVKADGTPNDIPQPSSGLFFGNNIIGGGANAAGIYDATRLRLREISLGYSLPKKLLGSSFVKGVNISLVANNVWYRAFNTPKSSKVDPDRTAFGSDNGIGFDFMGGPSARRMGATVKVTF